ncbi:hypothetical protein M427DRAFT_354514 [Gonapodya prolifera JEL478]|uniref:Ribosomal protein L17 n=1 Tax=Gonapodya prolifera (strain JEL478) TaxID=1344416 RepID=A0A139AC96_GONPJ|nr:hypothetical protein M427DRAFT_354514 [Gonapodya prolifera JEL478]|eukprot:KXS14095.1 hypothetical protein M427DRAFT_354514 [Gonapodya prolifera JEL478]
MRHQHKWRKLNRSPTHRHDLLSNLLSQLIVHDRIVTTVPKAKEVQKWAEQAIEVAGKGTNAAKLKLAGRVFNHHLTIPKLFSELKYRFNGQNGPYTRIHLLGVRPHDKAPRAILELKNSPRDLEYLNAKTNIDQLRAQLDVVETKIREAEVAARSILSSGADIPALRLAPSLRQDIYRNPSGLHRDVPVWVQLDRAQEVRKLQSQRRSLLATLRKMEKTLADHERAEESRRSWTEAELQNALRRKQEALEGVAARVRAFQRLGPPPKKEQVMEAVMEAGKAAMVGLQSGRVQSLTWDDWVRYRDTGAVTAVDVRTISADSWMDPSIKRPLKEPRPKKQKYPGVKVKRAEPESQSKYVGANEGEKEKPGYLKGVWDRVRGMSMLKNRFIG